MQAIETKYRIDRNGNGKIIASCAAKRKSFFQSDLEQECRERGITQDNENYHKLAAEKLCNELNWKVTMRMGTLKNGNNVFVLTHYSQIPE